MKYHFDNIQQFDDFITDAMKKGTFSKSEVKIGRGPPPPTREKDWDWAEPGYLYLTTNLGGVMYYVYRPITNLSINIPYIWWRRQGPHGVAQFTAVWEDLPGTSNASFCWVTRYLKLEESFGLFMNWIDENPLEVKG